MAKRKKSTKKNAPQLEQQPLESIDSSDEILLQSTDKATTFVAIHQNNLLQSSSAPDVNEAFSQDSQSHHSSVKDNDHESKLLDAISKVDPDYAPHLQHHHHRKEHHEFVTSQDPPHVYYVGGDEDLMDDEDESESAKLYNKDGEEEEIQAVDVTKRYERKQSLKQRLKNFSIRDIIVKWRYSIVYSLYLLFMSALAAFLFGWSIYKRGKIEEIWFLALEGLCTFAICYECVLSIFLYRRQFYKKLIVWCNLFVSLSAIIIFSLLLYCFIEKEENYFWNNVAFAQEAVIGLHCCVNAFRIIIYILQIRRGGGIVRNNVIVLDVSSNDISASPTAAHLAETTEHRYGTSQV